MFTINKSVSVWEQLAQLPFLNLYSRLLNAAMELDVFSQLCSRILLKHWQFIWDGIRQIQNTCSVHWYPSAF